MADESVEARLSLAASEMMKETDNRNFIFKYVLHDQRRQAALDGLYR